LGINAEDLVFSVQKRRLLLFYKWWLINQNFKGTLLKSHSFFLKQGDLMDINFAMNEISVSRKDTSMT
jgi:NAD+ kinase